MSERFPEDDLRLCLAAIAFTALAAWILRTGRAGADIGEKQNAYRNHNGHDEYPKIDTAFHN